MPSSSHFPSCRWGGNDASFWCRRSTVTVRPSSRVNVNEGGNAKARDITPRRRMASLDAGTYFSISLIACSIGLPSSSFTTSPLASPAMRLRTTTWRPSIRVRRKPSGCP